MKFAWIAIGCVALAVTRVDARDAKGVFLCWAAAAVMVVFAIGEHRGWKP
jgi:hypothetical protein